MASNNVRIWAWHKLETIMGCHYKMVLIQKRGRINCAIYRLHTQIWEVRKKILDSHCEFCMSINKRRITVVFFCWLLQWEAFKDCQGKFKFFHSFLRIIVVWNIWLSLSNQSFYYRWDRFRLKLNDCSIVVWNIRLSLSNQSFYYRQDPLSWSWMIGVFILAHVIPLPSI